MKKLIAWILSAGIAFGAPGFWARQVGTLANIPATCATGDLYFRTDVTAGTNLYECTSPNVWTQASGGGGGSGTVSSATAGQVAVYTASTTVGGNSAFTWNVVNGLSIGLPEPASTSCCDGPNTDGMTEVANATTQNSYVNAGTVTAHLDSYYTSRGTVTSPTNSLSGDSTWGVDTWEFFSGTYHLAGQYDIFLMPDLSGQHKWATLQKATNDYNSQMTQDGVNGPQWTLGINSALIGIGAVGAGHAELNNGVIVSGGGSLSQLDVGPLLLKGVVFASLPTPTNGMQIYCSDCKVTSGVDDTCANTGSGAMALRINGAWKCVQ